MSTTHLPHAVNGAAPEPVVRRGYLSVPELAEYLGVPVQTIWKWRKAGTAPKAVKLGRLVRFRLEDIREWEASRPAA